MSADFQGDIIRQVLRPGTTSLTGYNTLDDSHLPLFAPAGNLTLEMTDSTTDVKVRILELENLLLRRGISLPPVHVKTDDAASDVSYREVSSSQPEQSGSTARTRTSAQAEAKNTKVGQWRGRGKLGGRGRQCRMDRAKRALCRIMHAHGKSYKDIADVVNQTVTVVGTAIKNSYVTPDDTGADYDFMDAQTKTMYPPMLPHTIEALPSKDVSSVSRSTTTRVMVEIPCDRKTASQDSKKRHGSVLEFLHNLNLETLHPKLQEAGVDNEFFDEFRGWTDKVAGELLDDLVNAGIMNRVQAFKIRKALQEGS